MLHIHHQTVDICFSFLLFAGNKKNKVESENLMSVLFQVAAKALETAVFGAYYNVMINLKDITDDAFKEAVSMCVVCTH